MNCVLPAALAAQLARQAHTAFPRECCGLIEGVADEQGFQAIALHPGRNLASALHRFEIDPVDHIRAAKLARADGHGIIGCYHSHPGGQPRPSQHDLEGAQAENFLWLIAATDGESCDLAAFLYRAAFFEELVLAVGADCVTSSL